jgi:ABC-2 type transport system ATP-binding protein
MYAIECRQLSKIYGRGRRARHAVRDLTLAIEPQQIFGFLGPNGAGKTTTIRLLLDLIQPSGGEVHIFGQQVRRNPAAVRQVGAFIEGASFYPYLSGWDNLMVFGRTSGEFKASRAHELIEAVGLKGREQDKTGKYSTGMKQRLGIAAALLHDPPVLILDEPTSGLDPAGIREMRDFIRQLTREQGKTIFLSSHQLSEVQQICDRVGIIHRGELLAEGEVADLLKKTSQSQLILVVKPVEKAQAMLVQKWPVQPDTVPDSLIVTVPYEEIPAVVRLLVAAEVDVYGMEHRQASLEDFFLSVTA